MRFRINLERIAEIAAYEISKVLPFVEIEVETPLGTATSKVLKDQPVLATILRAGIPMHNGLLNYFDKADNAFVAAYRKHEKDGTFEIMCELLRQSRTSFIQVGDQMTHLDLSSDNERYKGTTDLIIKEEGKKISAKYRPLFTQGLTAGETAQTLWFQPLNNQSPRKVADLHDEQVFELSGLALSPDGRNFAVVEGAWNHDAVFIKGLKE